MKRFAFFILILAIGFSSCKKDDSDPDPNPTPTESVLQYFPLSVGNYWIYETSNCDSTWTECHIIKNDTVRITKDTLIGNKKYFKIESTNSLNYHGPSFLRDSLDYIINSFGDIIMSHTDFDTKFGEEYIVNQDTIYHWYVQMQEEYFDVQVPAGDFNCLDKKLSFFRYQENFEHEFNTHCFYAKNIGPIYHNWIYASTTAGIKQELIGFEFPIK